MPRYIRTRLLLSMFTCSMISLFALTPLTAVEAKKAKLADRIDEDSGLPVETVLKGELPEDEYWKFINPQIEYMKATFGPDITGPYDLFQKEALRTAGKGFENQDQFRILFLRRHGNHPFGAFFCLLSRWIRKG